MRRLSLRAFWWVLPAVHVVGCVLVSPLDDVAGAPRDGGSSDPDGSDGGGSKPNPRDSGTRGDSGQGDGGMQADAGMAGDSGAADGGAGACNPPSGAACDPVQACGCKAGERCEVRAMTKAGALVADAARCYPDPRGNRAPGAQCDESDDCAAGSTCGGYVCRQYCTSDADCDDGASCTPGADAEGATVEGLRFCLTPCDPSAPGACDDDTVCLPTSRQTWPHAFCYGKRDGSQAAQQSQPLFAACDMADARFPNCNDGLTCIPVETSAHGHCLPYCRDDSDCPPEVPTCMKQGEAWADETTRIGFCYGMECNEYTTPEPEPFSGPKPWTLAQYQSCNTQCGSDLACQTTNCPGAAQFQQCLAQAQEACVAALGGPCRAEYVALNCCEPCFEAPDFLTCAAAQCPTPYQAYDACVTDLECATMTVNACVQ